MSRFFKAVVPKIVKELRIMSVVIEFTSILGCVTWVLRLRLRNSGLEIRISNLEQNIEFEVFRIFEHPESYLNHPNIWKNINPKSYKN